ncbi:MAG: S8 family serine peptidase [Methanobacteriota archaeon]
MVGVLVAAFVFGSALAAFAEASRSTRIIVGYNGTLDDAARLVRGHGGQVTIAYRNIPVFAASVPAGAVGAIASARGIAFVEPDYIRTVTSHIIDGAIWTGTPQIVPYGTTNVRAPQAWALAGKGAGAKVAVLDTGFDMDHPDLAPNLLLDKAFDFLEMDTDVSDIPGPVTGHGTLTAGNIAALDNSIGTVGVAPEAKVLPYRVCNAALNACASSWIIGGIDRAITDGADVISMSFGGPAASIGERIVIRRAFLAGIVLVASSGNAGRPPVNNPAALPEVIAVGAVNVNNVLAGFSSFGHDQELVGPGVDVPSTFLSGQARDSLLRQTAPGEPALIGSIPMEFTVATDADGVTAPLALAGRATDAEVASLDLTGKIALIERGDITFKEKVENAASKGALGAVIYNNVAGDLAGTLQAPSTIPAVGITRSAGLALKAQIDGGAAVSIQLIGAASSYEEASGTSFSAPHVAGVAALVAAANGALSGFEIRVILDMTATDLGAAGYDRRYGFGLVNAEAAVGAALAP